MNQDKQYYVYGCWVKDQLVYVGKGKNNRYLHCTSGTSSCMDLNRDLFKYGKHSFRVYTVVDGLTEKEAFAMQKSVLMCEDSGLLYNRTYGINSKQVCDENLANEFWFYADRILNKECKWNGFSIFEDSYI